MSLQRYTIAIEDAKGPYANFIATRVEDKDKPWVKKLVKSYQSEEVRKFIETEFKGALIPAFYLSRLPTGTHRQAPSKCIAFSQRTGDQVLPQDVQRA